MNKQLTDLINKLPEHALLYRRVADFEPNSEILVEQVGRWLRRSSLLTPEGRYRCAKRFLRSLEQLGYGEYIEGRHGFQSRFKLLKSLDVALNPVAVAAVEVAPNVNVSKQHELSKMAPETEILEQNQEVSKVRATQLIKLLAAKEDELSGLVNQVTQATHAASDMVRQLQFFISNSSGE